MTQEEKQAILDYYKTHSGRDTIKQFAIGKTTLGRIVEEMGFRKNGSGRKFKAMNHLERTLYALTGKEVMYKTHILVVQAFEVGEQEVRIVTDKRTIILPRKGAGVKIDQELMKVAL